MFMVEKQIILVEGQKLKNKTMAKKYTPFKMKGHTLPGINQRSEGDTDLPDGRSGSSPFQEKSPAKQRTWGGTESEKGNIFTKRGRTQRKINRYERSETKIIDKLNKSGKDKNTGAWEDKAVKKAVKKSEK